MNKSVLITGAAKRIGKSIALSLADDGWNIALHYNTSKKEATETAKEIEEKGVKVALIKADLTNEKQTAKIIEKANKELGKISCLINNASIFHNDNISDFTSEPLDNHMKIHVYSPLTLSKDFAKQLNGSGNIINILDYSVWSLPDKFLTYSISKSALWTATQMLAKQLAPNIRVNGIGPGQSLKNKHETTESFKNAYKVTPLKIDAKPQEICSAIKFIISSPSMTGQMIALDGGKHLINADYY